MSAIDGSDSAIVAFWQQVSQNIIRGGSLNLLACNIAANGEGIAFLESFAQLLNLGAGGVTLNASNNHTSSATYQGDWNLEYSSPIRINQDNINEVYETFTVELSLPADNSSLVSIANGVGVGTIRDNDALRITIDDVTLAEGDSGTTDFVFTVTLSRASDQTITVDYTLNEEDESRMERSKARRSTPNEQGYQNSSSSS